MNKIEALEKTIYNLENDVYKYCWDSYRSCNCGVLASSILGRKLSFETDDFFQYSYTGSGFSGSCSNSKNYCEQTGMPLQEVYKCLYDAGFSDREISNLETLDDDTILNRASLNLLTRNYESKDHLIQYLKVWVKMLKEQEEERSVASKEQSELLQSETKRKNITKSLAVFPVEEKSDLKTLNKVV